MKLDRKNWLRLMANALGATIIEIFEPELKIRGQLVFIYYKAMVLASYVATASKDILTRLIDTAMAVGQLIGVTAQSEIDQLIAKANTK
jgi:hypothetical protein